MIQTSGNRLAEDVQRNRKTFKMSSRLEGWKSFVSVMHSGCEGNSLNGFDVLIKITAHATDLNLNGIVPRNIHINAYNGRSH